MPECVPAWAIALGVLSPIVAAFAAAWWSASRSLHVAPAPPLEWRPDPEHKAITVGDDENVIAYITDYRVLFGRHAFSGGIRYSVHVVSKETGKDLRTHRDARSMAQAKAWAEHYALGYRNGSNA